VTKEVKLRSRRMTDGDIATVVGIISAFRKKPTWADVEKRARKQGLPFSQEALRRKPEIQVSYNNKVESLLAKETEAQEALAEADSEMFADLRAQILELRIAIETVYANAAELGVPIEDLNRPLKYVDHERTEPRRPK